MRTPTPSAQARPTSSFARQARLVALSAAAAAYGLLTFEWLFLVTKPSMFTVMEWPQKVAILLAAALLTALAAAAVGLLLAAVARLVAGRRTKHAAAAGLLVPAVLTAVTVFLLVENFTKTVFGFNIGSYTSPVRYLYAAGWLALVAYCFWRLARRLTSSAARPSSRPTGLALIALAAVSAFGAWVRYEPQAAAERLSAGGRELPNILIFSSDGVNAERMSVYGYRRPTTPFLDSLVDEMLVSENHFTNSSATAVSIGSLLTGKLPSTTGVIDEGDAFRGRDVFEHLPGLLRQLGYYNIDVTARYYGDAYDLNIRQGFHVANGRSLRTETLPVMRFVGRAWPSEFYFVSLSLERARQRLLHAFGVADMQDFYDAVAKRFTPWTRDAAKIDLLKSELERAPRPFFANVHLLDTHPVKGLFNVDNPKFGVGDVRGEERRQALYDDTIGAFDDHIRDIVAHLDAAGELERTLLVVNSDHSSRRWSYDRLPLLFRFPRGEHSGRIRANTQRVDIAPTIFSYLGLEPPDWMAGQSLIDGDLDPQRLILAAGSRRRRLSWMAVVQCQKAFLYFLVTGELEEHEVPGHTAQCPAEGLLGETEARGYLVAQLASSPYLDIGFPVQVISLARHNDAESHRQVARAMRDGRAGAEPLAIDTLVSQVHEDFWTWGTHPAVLLVRNDEDEPRSPRLAVYSGRGGDFPSSFYLQDDASTREFTFAKPGRHLVRLTAVPAHSERLFLVWSDRTWGEPDGRPMGVRLSLIGEDLARLLRRSRPAERQQVTRWILERKVPAVRFDSDSLAANVHGDRWTRGIEPAGVVVRNPGAQPLETRLVVQSGARPEFPLSFYVEDAGRVEEYVFVQAGRLAVDLPALPPGSERLFIVWSGQAWTPGAPGSRALGVRLRLEPRGTESGTPKRAPAAPGS